MQYQPDYRNLLMAARNIEAPRLPLYEHLISPTIMEQIMDRQFAQLLHGDTEDKREYLRNYTEFFRMMGYDTVSFEICIGDVLPGGGALGGHVPGVIKTREDFDRYPWDEIPGLYFKKHAETFRLLREVMPPGMKAVGGPGNGVFELVQDIVGYMDLCYIKADDPELYADLFRRMGDVQVAIWERFLKEFGDIYAVCRFGDDLGFKVATLLAPEDIRTHIIPQYKRVIDLVHAYDRPFLLHSCGNIFAVMDDLIHKAGIDAKHSNEDAIAPFQVWVEKYGHLIGNFGGVDTDVLCQRSEGEIKAYVKEVISQAKGHGGFALGSGNSIPNYVPVEGYMAMLEAANEVRLKD